MRIRSLLYYAVSLFIVVLLANGAFAQTTMSQTFAQTTMSQTSTAPRDSLTLEECIQLALQNKADVKIAHDQVRMADAQLEAAWGNFLPSVNFSLRGSRNVQGEGRRFFSGLEFTAPASTREYYSSGLSLSQPIFTGGRLLNNRKYAMLNSQQADIGYANTKEQVIMDVVSAYFQVLRAREFVRVYESTLESSQAQVDLVKERYNLGAVAQSDVYKAQTQAGNDRINLLQQQNTLATQKRNLNLMMGREPMTPVVLPEFDYTSPEIPDEETAQQQAVRTNRNLEQYRLDVEMSRANVAIARSSLMPSVSASFGYDRSGFLMADLYRELDKNWSYSLGVNLSVPIFNRLQTRTQMATRKYQLSTAQQRYQDAELSVKMQVDNLIQQLKTYNEIISLNEINLQSAEEDLRLAKERYNIGQATLLDVLDAQASLTNAQRILVYAKFDAKTQEAQLQAAMGELLSNRTGQ